jgi:hypothetical protein
VRSVIKSKIHHIGAQWAEDVEYLCHGRYLPIEVFTANLDGETTKFGLHSRISERDNCLVVE